MAGCHLRLFGTLEEKLAGKEREREHGLKASNGQDNHRKRSRAFFDSKSGGARTVKLHRSVSN